MMTWFIGNTIDWKTSDAKIKKAYLELTGEDLDLTNRAEFDTSARYLHDAIYPKCTCIPDSISFYDTLVDTEEKYAAITHTNPAAPKGLF